MASTIEPELKTRRWRRVEYERLVELGMFTGERLELLDGLLVVREPQGSPHAATVAQVGRVLERAFGAGWHARYQAPLALDDDSEPEPDVAMVSGQPLSYATAHPSTAAIVVEVADSSLRLDRRLKAGSTREIDCRSTGSSIWPIARSRSIAIHSRRRRRAGATPRSMSCSRPRASGRSARPTP